MKNSCEPDYYRAFEALLAGNSQPMNAYFQNRRKFREIEDCLDQKQLMELEPQVLAQDQHH
ncbi:hypothetical protein DKQ62_16495 [Halomonas elongata]|nr:hypothetical protein DKQ62_16495 [Halomonas elongata]